jgi:VCBS repeat-containing protein
MPAMNKLIALAVAAGMIPAVACAGEVFGIVKNASGVVEGADVAADCGGKSYGPVKTDKKGSYRLTIAQTGKCTLTLTHGGKSATMNVVSFDDATQSDVVLAVGTDGKLTAKRG